MGVAAICWAIWKLRNKACFEEKKLIRSPAEIVCYACAFLRYWAGLHMEVDRSNILAGAAAFQSEALRHHGDQARTDRKRPLEYIQDEDDQAASRGKQKKDEEP